MTDEQGNALRSAPPLFVDDKQLREIMAPHVGLDRFRSTLRALELRGFPRKSDQFNGRYYPAVRAWLDANNGVSKDGRSPQAQDGAENWNAPSRTSPRPKVAPPQGRKPGALLGSEPGRS